MCRSIRLVLSMLLAAFLSVGAATHATAGSKVYLMRGLADVSTGLDELATKLKRAGIAALVDSYTAEPSVAARAIRDYKSNGGPIVIIGHSLGADAAIAMAEELRAARVPVALIVTFSPAYSLAVPANVARLTNYYQSNSIWNATYRAGPGFHGSLRNVNLASDPDIHHFNIEKSPRLHRATLSAIQGLTGAAPVPVASAAVKAAPADAGAK